MAKHPEIGARVLAAANLDDISGWVVAHHERPDGQGYPAGLAGDEIPLESRILAVADSFEAMTSDRVYRRAIPLPAAVAELRKHSGAQFDSGVVEAFLATLETTGSAAAAEDPWPAAHLLAAGLAEGERRADLLTTESDG